MPDREGDRTKKSDDCNSFTGRATDCPNLKDVTPGSMEKESYSCERCGRYFVLYYDEMK